MDFIYWSVVAILLMIVVVPLAPLLFNLYREIDLRLPKRLQEKVERIFGKPDGMEDA